MATEIDWLTPKEAAEILPYSETTLCLMRQDGRGPAFFQHKKGASVRYKRSDVEAWIEDHTESCDTETSGDDASGRRKASA